MAYHPFRDFWLKAASVTLAVMLWLSVGGEPVVERGMDVPIEFENVPDGLEIVGDPPATVRVRVRGSSSVVSRLEPGEVVVLLDLGDERPGQRLFNLLADRLIAPRGVDVTNVVPATVTLTLERAGQVKSVPVVPTIEGVPADGLTFGRITTTPATVDVVGPETPLGLLEEAYTEPISVSGARSGVVDEVMVGVADPTLRLVEPVSARVEIEIVQDSAEVTILDVPVEWRDRPGARRVTSVEPESITVGVRGPRNAIRRVTRDVIRAVIDVTGLADQPAAQYNLPVVVEVTDDLRIIHIDPPSVRVQLR